MKRRTSQGRYQEAQAHYAAGRFADAEKLCRQMLKTTPRDGQLWHLLGLVCQRQERTDEALTALRQAGQLMPRDPEVWGHLAECLRQANQLDDAEQAARRALAEKPNHVPALNNLGLVLVGRGRPREAEQCYRQAIELEPGYARAHYNLGNLLREQDRPEEAETCLKQALQLRPDYPEALTTLGALLGAQGRYAEGTELLHRALKLRPRHTDTVLKLAGVLGAAREYDKALACYERALSWQPGSVRALLGKASVHAEMKERAAATELLERVSRHPIEDPDLLAQLGDVLLKLDRDAEARTAFEQAVRRSPDCVLAHCGLSHVFLRGGQAEEALARARHALYLRPGNPAMSIPVANALAYQRQFDEAQATLEQALRLHPDCHAAAYNLSLLQLTRGQWQPGWRGYENRIPVLLRPVATDKPAWDGSPLAGRTLLVIAEQGLGDTIQFVRYLDQLRGRGGRVVLACQPALLSFLRGSLAQPGGTEVLLSPLNEPLPAHDACVFLLSLPALFGTTEETMPRTVPYLHPEPDRVERWQERLWPIPGRRIGIAWQGNANYANDRQRSIPLHAFSVLADVPRISLVSLQKGPGTEQIAALRDSFSVRELEGLDQNGAFVDTAAVMKCLDLVITSDTSIPHLAGSLGVPVWVILSSRPDWRWLLDRADSPWYPTMRLFRQEPGEDWPAVCARVTAELRAHFGLPPADPAALATRPLPALPVEPPARLPAPARSSGRAQPAECRHGRMLFPPNDQYIGRSLDLYGEYSEGEVELFRRLVRPGDTVVDVGAHVGAHAVALARLVGAAGRVLAFEPQRGLFYRLCANAVLNDLRNVWCHQTALAAEERTIDVPDLHDHADANFGGLALQRRLEGLPTCQVLVRTLDSFALDSCRLIKIDVEGMEEQVLRGAQATIERHRPLLYLEDDRQEKSASLRSMLASLGYTFLRHCPPYYRPGNYRHNPDNVFGPTVSINLLCHPRDELCPVSEKEFGLERLV